MGVPSFCALAKAYSKEYRIARHIFFHLCRHRLLFVTEIKYRGVDEEEEEEEDEDEDEEEEE